jgi:hypothetical protein
VSNFAQYTTSAKTIVVLGRATSLVRSTCCSTATTIRMVRGAVVTVRSRLYFVIEGVSVVFVSAMTVALYLIAVRCF